MWISLMQSVEGLAVTQRLTIPWGERILLAWLLWNWDNIFSCLCPQTDKKWHVVTFWIWSLLPFRLEPHHWFSGSLGFLTWIRTTLSALLGFLLTHFLCRSWDLSVSMIVWATFLNKVWIFIPLVLFLWRTLILKWSIYLSGPPWVFVVVWAFLWLRLAGAAVQVQHVGFSLLVLFWGTDSGVCGLQ